MAEKNFDLCRKSPLFARVPADKLQELAAMGSLRGLKSGEQLLGEGGRTRKFYIVASGRLSVKLKLPNSIFSESLALIGAGGVIGESVLLGRDGASAMVEAIEPAEVLEWDGIELEAALTATSAVGLVVMQNLARILQDRVVETNELLRRTFHRVIDLD